jgi:glutamate synthase domain-containing protein 3
VRSLGARLSGEIARKHGATGLPAGTIKVNFEGSAGQSFAAFNNRGVHMTLKGEAQDYVAKGMYGGEVVIKPTPSVEAEASKNTIIGNTVMYGATGGSLYAAGRAGERLCVRNSGGKVVVEGCGDHGCEYMTGGVAVILGETGRNFGAGMSGGVAYVYDSAVKLELRLNKGMVQLEKVTKGLDEELLRTLIERHALLTESRKAKAILANWQAELSKFWRVSPHPILEDASAEEQSLQLVEELALQALRLESGFGHAQASD